MLFRLELKSRITEKYAGETLIDSLSRRFTYHDRSYWLDRIAAGQLQVNGRAGEPLQILQTGDELQFCIPDFYERDLDTRYHKIWKMTTSFSSANRPICLCTAIIVLSTRR